MAPDGEEGLKQAIEGKPDAILLDIMMPKLDGIGNAQAVSGKTPRQPGSGNYAFEFGRSKTGVRSFGAWGEGLLGKVFFWYK